MAVAHCTSGIPLHRWNTVDPRNCGDGSEPMTLELPLSKSTVTPSSGGRRRAAVVF